MLVDAFLRQLGARHKHRAHVSPEAMGLLRRYDWPGNVRELRNALERTLVLCEGDEITSADLPEEIREYAGAAGAGPPVLGSERRNRFGTAFPGASGELDRPHS